jgi:hypothetical protein
VGKLYAEIDQQLRAFLEAQHMFFVATAPSGAEGHVNCSPKGLDSFRVLDGHTVAYLDFNGSGIETVAHIRENGRIVMMFCAFADPPKIVRLHGHAEVIEPGDGAFESLLAGFSGDHPPVRAIVRTSVSRISDSCGYGVPLLAFEADRPQMHAWAERRAAAGIVAYQREKNTSSIDGLGGLRNLSRP